MLYSLLHTKPKLVPSHMEFQVPGLGACQSSAHEMEAFNERDILHLAPQNQRRGVMEPSGADISHELMAELWRYDETCSRLCVQMS